MLIELAAIFIAFGLPVLAGFALTRKHPRLAAWKIAALGALPMVLCFCALVAYLASSGIDAPYGLASAMVFGVMAALVGFGLGMVGQAIASKGRK